MISVGSPVDEIMTYKFYLFLSVYESVLKADLRGLVPLLLTGALCGSPFLECGAEGL